MGRIRKRKKKNQERKKINDRLATGFEAYQELFAIEYDGE